MSTVSKPFEEDGFVWPPGDDQRSVAHVRSDPKLGTDITLINAAWSVSADTGHWPVLHGESLWAAPWTLLDVGLVHGHVWDDPLPQLPSDDAQGRTAPS